MIARIYIGFIAISQFQINIVQGLYALRNNITLTGELWGVYYGKFEENWPRYNGTVL